MSYSIFWITLLSLASSMATHGQTKYWVPAEKKHLLDEKTPTYCSKWLKVCSYQLTAKEAEELGLRNSEAVQSFERTSWQSGTSKNLGFALEQIEGQLLIDKGLTGRGVKIGIIDGGFLGAPEDPSLSNFYEKQLVKSYKDYINPRAEAYKGSKPLDDDHGTRVWQMIGGIHPTKKIQYGLATEATYFLARTDHGSYEKRIEEDYLIEALEWMGEQGIRLINISLGYAKGYSDPNENYTPEDMDGKTSMMARAIDSAYFKKDMLVVVAAGNEGSDKKWLVVSTPGDAKGALTVGASKLRVWDKMNYSSIGPNSLPYTKPDIACYSTSGTSFSAPIITGLAASLMQYDSSLSAQQIRAVIEQSGHFYPYANNYLGNGVPRVSLIFDLLEKKETQSPLLLSTKRGQLTLRGKYANKVVVIYHKMDSTTVASRSFLRPEKNLVKVKRMSEAAFSTVLVGNSVIEIDWLN